MNHAILAGIISASIVLNNDVPPSIQSVRKYVLIRSPTERVFSERKYVILQSKMPRIQNVRKYVILRGA